MHIDCEDPGSDDFSRKTLLVKDLTRWCWSSFTTVWKKSSAWLIRQDTVGNIGIFWLITKFKFKFGPKKVDFLKFWHLFWWFFQILAPNCSLFFKFSLSKGRKNLNFWASKLMKLYFWAKNFCEFVMSQKWSIFSTV